MNFSEKLKYLRKQKNLTQEQLSDKLFVSRTAVSKWESGMGFPSIDSLKDIANFFEISVDDLISSKEVISFADKSIKKDRKTFSVLICGIVDLLNLLLLFLPFYNEFSGGKYYAVSLINLENVSTLILILNYLFIGLTGINAVFQIIIIRFNDVLKIKYTVIIGFILTIVLLLFLILTKTPYASIYSFCLLIIKTFMYVKLK